MGRRGSGPIFIWYNVVKSLVYNPVSVQLFFQGEWARRASYSYFKFIKPTNILRLFGHPSLTKCWWPFHFLKFNNILNHILIFGKKILLILILSFYHYHSLFISFFNSHSFILSLSFSLFLSLFILFLFLYVSRSLSLSLSLSFGHCLSLSFFLSLYGMC